MEPSSHDVEALIRDKYDGNRDADLADDLARLAQGEPLAYVIGWIPFLGLKIYLDSHPLIPRPETEWWTEKLVDHLKETKGSLLDLCAGSGAIGLSVLDYAPGMNVSFGELIDAHTDLIRKNILENNLDTSRADIRSGDLFAPFDGRFNVIATNPPYIPNTRTLPESVSSYEPSEALYSGEDGLELITRIITEAPAYLTPGGELWIECDVDNSEAAAVLMREKGFTKVEIHTDPYGRQRLLVGHYEHGRSDASTHPSDS